MQMLERRIDALKRIIEAHDGENVADATFRREVDAVVDQFYDDIGRVTTVSARNLFDLFVIKTLYVERRSRDAGVVDYLGGILTRHLYTRELFPMTRGRTPSLMYLSDLLAEMRQPVHFQNLFETYRQFADNALFITGVLPRSLRRTRGGHGALRASRSGFVDASYYITWGKAYYRRAAEHDLAELTRQRETLLKLSRYFEVYMDALNEASEDFIMGLDMDIIANKMLDSFNRYQETGDAASLENARKFAALLKIDSEKFPALYRRRGRRAALLTKPNT